MVARVDRVAFDEGESGVPRTGGEAVAERSCGEERSAQTREYAPLLAMAGGLREVAEGRCCGSGLRGGGGLPRAFAAGAAFAAMRPYGG
ncbi:MAG TPA: hypothetical protein VII38_03590, partial [Polyangia bacterium]